MNSFKEHLQSQHCDPNSHTLRTIQILAQKTKSEAFYQKAIRDLTNVELQFVSLYEAKCTYLYLIEDFLKHSDSPLYSKQASAMNSKQKATEFIENNKWILVANSEDDEQGQKNVLGSVLEIYRDNRHAVSKRQMMELIQENVPDVKKGTLYSYLTLCKKKFGPCYKEDRSSKPKSKMDKIREALRTSNRTFTPEEMIEFIRKVGNTSNAGAKTYYYTIKKEFPLAILFPDTATSKEIALTLIDQYKNEELSKQEWIDLIYKESKTKSLAGAQAIFYEHRDKFKVKSSKETRVEQVKRLVQENISLDKKQLQIIIDQQLGIKPPRSNTLLNQALEQLGVNKK